MTNHLEKHLNVNPEVKPAEGDWHFGKTASAPWKVVESDFDPRDTMFDEGDPDRSDMRVTVAHEPSRTIYVGQPGTHHADLINAHDISDDPDVSPYERWSILPA